MHLWVSPFMEPPKWVGSKHDQNHGMTKTHDFRPTTPIQKRALKMCRKHLLGAWEQGRSSVSTLGSWFRPSVEKQPWIKLGDSLWDIFYHQSNIGVDQQTLWGCADLVATFIVGITVDVSAMVNRPASWPLLLISSSEPSIVRGLTRFFCSQL